jgi:hypothetical protein
VWGIIPKLKEIISTYMRHVSIRVDLFEKISEELKSVQESFEVPEREDGQESENFREESAREAIIRKK